MFKSGIVCSLLCFVTTTYAIGTHFCVHYNLTESNEVTKSSCNETKQACFVAWVNETIANGTSFNLSSVTKGCWSESRDCPDKCIDNKPDRKHYNFCCCRGNMCNTEFYHIPTQPGPPPDIQKETNTLIEWLWISGVICLVLILLIAIWRSKWRLRIFLFITRRSSSENAPCFFNKVNKTNRNDEIEPFAKEIIKVDQCERLDVIARGRFCTVYRGIAKLVKDSSVIEVAIKCLPSQEYQSAYKEEQVYTLPQMDHENILKFYGYGRKFFDDVHCEHWIVTEYLPLGSLFDYLKHKTISWQQMILIARGIAKGMAHLHEDILGTGREKRKPSVAHKDFKSKNVILRNNLTPCIADFDLAYIFYPDQGIGVRHGQTGTRRYMAPEFLEGSIGFTSESFIKVDVYAIGLVLWELISRCVINDEQPEPYKPPFQDEVGDAPDTAAMHKVVVLERKRPLIKDDWLKNPMVKKFCNCITECWDHEPLARSSAANIYETLRALGEESKV